MPTSPIGPSNTVHGTGGDDSVHISKASGLAGLLGLYEVNVNGQAGSLRDVHAVVAAGSVDRVGGADW